MGRGERGGGGGTWHTQGVRNHKVGPPGRTTHEVVTILLKHLAHRRDTREQQCCVMLQYSTGLCFPHGKRWTPGRCCQQTRHLFPCQSQGVEGMCPRTSMNRTSGTSHQEPHTRSLTSGATHEEPLIRNDTTERAAATHWTQRLTRHSLYSLSSPYNLSSRLTEHGLYSLSSLYNMSSRLTGWTDWKSKLMRPRRSLTSATKRGGRRASSASVQRICRGSGGQKGGVPASLGCPLRSARGEGMEAQWQKTLGPCHVPGKPSCECERAPGQEDLGPWHVRGSGQGCGDMYLHPCTGALTVGCTHRGVQGGSVRQRPKVEREEGPLRIDRGRAKEATRRFYTVTAHTQKGSWLRLPFTSRSCHHCTALYTA